MMVQLFTLIAFHVIVVEPPINTRLGAAVMESVGTVTVTIAVAGAEVPPGPVQVTE